MTPKTLVTGSEIRHKSIHGHQIQHQKLQLANSTIVWIWQVRYGKAHQVLDGTRRKYSNGKAYRLYRRFSATIP